MTIRGWALGALLVILPAPASAQHADPAGQVENAEPEAGEPPHFTEEVTVTVTARKREENLQSVPFSVVAPTQQALRNRGAGSIEDVSANVAGFSVQNLGPGQSQIAMRGVSAGQIVRDQPGVKEQVGVYLDESVISLSLFTPDLDLFDMSRIEVLRGPQGTLFGSGSLSGTVRYITNQPAIGVTEAASELGFSSLNGGGLGNNAKFAVNVPLGPAAAAHRLQHRHRRLHRRRAAADECQGERRQRPAHRRPRGAAHAAERPVRLHPAACLPGRGNGRLEPHRRGTASTRTTSSPIRSPPCGPRSPWKSGSSSRRSTSPTPTRSCSATSPWCTTSAARR